MSAGQEFNLRWNNHTNNMLQVFMEQLSSESLVDVTLSCQGRFIKAHKMVLSACSPYFQEVFNQHSVQHPVIIMNGFRFEDAKAIVEFMYKGEVKVSEANLQTLLAAAESLQVKGLCTVRNSGGGPGGEEGGGAMGAIGTPTVNKIAGKQFGTSTNLLQTPDSGNGSQSSGVSSAGNTTGAVAKKRRRRNAHEGTTMAAIPVKRMAIPSGLVARAAPDPAQNDQVEDSNDDLPPMIKIEPPEIRDIDEEDSESGGWDSPRLVIDTDSAMDGGDKWQQKDGQDGPDKGGTSKNPGSGPGPSHNLHTTSQANPKATSHILTSSVVSYPIPAPAVLKEKIPRPPNAFMIFANEWRKKLAVENPSESNKEISIRLGIMWKNLGLETKEGYYAAAKQANEEHKRKYPDYFYSPKEARLRKKLKQQAMNRGGQGGLGGGGGGGGGAGGGRQGTQSGNYDVVQLVKVYMKDDEEDGASVSRTGEGDGML